MTPIRSPVLFDTNAASGYIRGHEDLLAVVDPEWVILGPVFVAGELL